MRCSYAVYYSPNILPLPSRSHSGDTLYLSQSTESHDAGIVRHPRAPLRLLNKLRLSKQQVRQTSASEYLSDNTATASKKRVTTTSPRCFNSIRYSPLTVSSAAHTSSSALCISLFSCCSILFICYVIKPFLFEGSCTLGFDIRLTNPTLYIAKKYGYCSLSAVIFNSHHHFTRHSNICIRHRSTR